MWPGGRRACRTKRSLVVLLSSSPCRKALLQKKQSVSTLEARHPLVYEVASSFLFSVYQGNEIQRVWSLHDVLLSLDHTSDDNQQIKELLLQCFQRPAYIRSDDVSPSMFSHFVFCDSQLVIIVAAALSCQTDDEGFVNRESDSWCFFSAGTWTSSGLFMAPSKTSWSFVTSKMNV